MPTDENRTKMEVRLERKIICTGLEHHKVIIYAEGYFFTVFSVIFVYV